MADALLDRLDELTSRIIGIETRLGAVEQSLGWPGTLQAPPAEALPSLASPPASSLPPVPPPLPPSVHPTPQPITQAMLADAADAARTAARTPAIVSAWSTQPIHPAPPALATARPGRSQTSLEDIIGRNWTSWVGAIVVVLGVLFFLKYAWDQGWLALSPTARVMSAIVTGVAFGIAGEFVRRRRDMRVLAGTLTGAGVAIVMAASFAGHTMFDPPVFSARLAMAGVCVAAGAGIGSALRMNIMSLAIIALLGAYLAPVILRSDHDESLSLIGYLAALASVGWTLAYLKPRWGALRWFTWTCTVLWMTAWIIWFPMRDQHEPLAILAVAFFFTGFMAEAYLTLHRAFRTRDKNDQTALPAFVGILETSLATMSMLTTAAAFAAYYALLRGATFALPDGFFHLGPISAIALGLVAMHGVIERVTPSRLFARSSLLQTAALATLAVPLALGHVAVTLAWLALAVALAALGWRRENRAVRAWAIILLGLALARLFTLDRMDAALQTVLFHVGGQEVTTWLILASLMAVLTHGVGWLILPVKTPSDPNTKQQLATYSIELSAIGTLVFFIASVMSWHGVELTLLWIAGAIALIALARRGPPLLYAQQAAVLLFITAIKWIALDNISPIAAAWDQLLTSARPIFNAMALAGVLLTALLVWLARWSDQESRPTLLAAAGIVGFALANFETLRTVDYFATSFADFATAKVVALSVLWGLIGLAAVVVGFARQLRPLRYAALGLLGVTLAKILLVDLAHVRPVYRILSFLAVGGLLLCVSFVYHRHTEQRRAA
jgi:uncharacterized membrane protein